jgi:predicted HicB family RNase H-like nuclease
MMNYKGYVGVVRVDPEQGVLRGKVINSLDTVTFQGKTFEEALQAFHDSVDDYLEFCESLGRAPEKPFSGSFVVRLTPELHRDLTALALSEGISVNKLVVRQLSAMTRPLHGDSAPAHAHENLRWETSGTPRLSGVIQGAREAKAPRGRIAATRHKDAPASPKKSKPAPK